MVTCGAWSAEAASASPTPSAQVGTTTRPTDQAPPCRRRFEGDAPERDGPRPDGIRVVPDGWPGRAILQRSWPFPNGFSGSRPKARFGSLERPPPPVPRRRSCRLRVAGLCQIHRPWRPNRVSSMSPKTLRPLAEPWGILGHAPPPQCALNLNPSCQKACAVAQL